MKKAIKIAFITIASLLLLLIIGLVVVVNTIDLNDYKSQISTQIQQATGRPLTIDGNINWSLFPWLGITVEQVTLGNPRDFPDKTPLVAVAQIDISVKLLSLLSGQVDVDTFALKKPTIHLITSKQGHTNFDFKQHTDSITITQQSKGSSSSNAQSTPSTISADVHDLNISSGKLIWDDKQTNQRAVFNNINITIKHAGLSQSHIQLNTIKFTVNASTLHGDVDITKLTTAPNAKFDLHIDTLNLDQYLESKPPTTAQQHTQYNFSPIATAYAAPTTTSPPWIGMLRQLHANGQLHIDQLQAMNFHATDVTLGLQARAGKLQITPMQATFYKGTYEGKYVIDVSSGTPQMTASETLRNVALQPMLKDALGSTMMTGKLQFHINGSTHGFTQQAMLQNMQGNGNFQVDNGALQGIDIRHQLQSISQFATAANKKTFPSIPAGQSSRGQTKFTKLSGSIQINNGIARNHDFILASPQFQITGKGSVNLVSQAVNYRLQITEGANANKSTHQLFAKIGSVLGKDQLPILISGSLTHMTASPDWTSIQGNVLKHQGKQLLQDTGKQLKKLLKF